jgi:hypothetical protein
VPIAPQRASTPPSAADESDRDVVLFTLVVAGLVAAILVSVALLIEAFRARAQIRTLEQQRAIAEYAVKTGGVVTPRTIAKALKITPLEADRLLRGMVDDVHLFMEIDVREGELRYVFPRLLSGAENR